MANVFYCSILASWICSHADFGDFRGALDLRFALNSVTVSHKILTYLPAADDRPIPLHNSNTAASVKTKLQKFRVNFLLHF